MIKETYIWILILVIGLGLVFYSQFYKDRVPVPGGGVLESEEPKPIISETVTSTPAVSVAPAATVRPEATSKPSGTPIQLVQSPVPRDLITGPATCQLSGSIHFLEENLYETKEAKLAYQNIDDSSRLINWKFSPDDGAFKAGPNIFSNIRPLPNGVAGVGATMYGKPTVKSYVLTAQVTYGMIEKNGIETVKTADCAGSITVTAP